MKTLRLLPILFLCATAWPQAFGPIFGPNIPNNATSFVLTNILNGTNAAGILENLSAPRYVTATADLAACGTDGPSSVVTLGYAAAGDSGGGLWNRVAAATYTADGGTVVDGVGCQWVRQWTGPIDPIWFGADPTGATDSRNAIQAAFLAGEDWDRDVVCSDGDYRVITVPGYPIDNRDRSWIGTGGRLWWSLPDGYDFNVATAWTKKETNVFTGVMNNAGALINVTNVTPINCPWNGKGFFAYNTKKWDGLILDCGWGTTDAPTGVVPITGVSFASGEYVYYKVYSNPNSVTDPSGPKFVNCKISNLAGHAFVAIANAVIDHCEFYEMGDHAFYLGGDGQDNNIFSNNRIYGLRTDSGSDYDRDFIFGTKREAIKLQNNSGIQILNNYSTNAYGAGTFAGLYMPEAWDSALTNVVVKGNVAVGHANGVTVTAARNANMTDLTRIYAAIEGNDFRVALYPIYIDGPMGEGSVIKDNYLSSDSLAAGSCIAVVRGNTEDWQYPVHLTIQGNVARGALSFFNFTGPLGKVNIIGNYYKPWTGTGSPAGTHALVYASGGSSPSSWQGMVLNNNTVVDTSVLWYSAAASTYSAGTTYTCSTNAWLDYTKEYKPVVYYSTATNVWWRAVQTSTGQTPGTAGDTYWAPYTRPYGTLALDGNTQKGFTTSALLFSDQTADRRNFVISPAIGSHHFQASANSFFSSGNSALGNTNLIPRTWGPLVSGYRASTETPDGNVPGFPGQLLTTYATGALYQQLGVAAPFTNWAIIPPFYGVTTTTPTVGLRAGGNFLSNDTHYVYNGSGFVPVNMGQGPITALSVTAVSAAINTTAYSTKYKLNPDADRVLTSAPQITDGFEGQIIYVYVDDAEANTVTFTDEGTHANSNLYVGGTGTNVVISAHNSRAFMFTGGSWNLLNH